MSDSPIGEIIEAGTTAFIAQCLDVPRRPVPTLYDPPPFGSFVKITANAPTGGGPPRPPIMGGVGEEASPLTPPIIGGPGGPLVGLGGAFFGGATSEDEEDPFAPSPASPRAVAAGTPLPAATFALVYGASTASLDAGRRPSALGFADEDELRAQQPQIFELLRTEFSGLLIAHSAGDGKALRRHLPPKPPRIHSRVYPCDAGEVRALTEDLSFLRGLLLPSGGALAGVPSDELVAACLRQARDAQANEHQFLQRAGKTLAMLLADDYDRLRAILRNVL